LVKSIYADQAELRQNPGYGIITLLSKKEGRCSLPGTSGKLQRRVGFNSGFIQNGQSANLWAGTV
jgi:hypothetical protein